MSFYNDKILNLFRSQAAGVLSSFTHLRIGLVTNYDPNTYSAKVQLQPEGTLTGYLPILTTWVGNQWGFYTPPSINDMVVIHFMEGSLSVGFIGERIFNIVELPINPGPPAGEAWMVHKTGSFLKFKNDGTVDLTCLDPNGNPTALNINANMVVTGSITASKDILDNSATNTNNMKAMRTIYDEHTHSGVTAGGANTGIPNQPE